MCSCGTASARYSRANPSDFAADADFADLHSKLGQPAYAPWRLALVTLMQFREGLSDRQAADAVRSRIDWKHSLALELADAGSDFSVLREIRGRLLQHKGTERLLAPLLDAAREDGLLGPGASAHGQHARARCRSDPEPAGAGGRNAARGCLARVA